MPTELPESNCQFPLVRARFDAEKGHVYEAMDWRIIPPDLWPRSERDLAEEGGERILAAWEAALGEKLKPITRGHKGSMELVGVFGKDYSPDWSCDRPLSRLEFRWVRDTHRMVKRRSADSSITFDEIALLIRKADGKCQVTGIEFEWQRGEGVWRSPWKPSLDRINSARGYTLRNCRVVCCAVNIAMNEWGIEALDKVARAYVAKHPMRTDR